MIKLIGGLQDIGGVAVSGGVDSMALLSFMRYGKHRPDAYFYHHNTEDSEKAFRFLLDYCGNHKITLHVEKLEKAKPQEDSWEEFWRNERYRWLHAQPTTIATAHHLNDAAETYVWGCAHGHPRYIHYRQPSESQNIVRPLLLTPKQELVKWCQRKGVPFVEDGSNRDLRFVRNRVRHNIIPEILQINPGFLTVVKRLVEARLEFIDNAKDR